MTNDSTSDICTMCQHPSDSGCRCYQWANKNAIRAAIADCVSAEIAIKDPAGRRVVRDERMGLQARGEGRVENRHIAECYRVIKMWAGK